MSESLYICNSCQKPISFGVAYCPTCGQPQTTGTGPLWLGERRLVTILFADLASFTSTSEKADPEDVIDMLNHVFTRLMVECDREGGYLDKTVGDQLMILFGAPRAHEDDPARAVRAALGMQKAMEELAPMMREKVGASCKINIGINTGPVVWGRMGPTGRAAPTVIGDVVNLASRLQHIAASGQILVSETVYLQTRRSFEYEVLEPIQVKGKSGLIPIYMPLRPRHTAHSAKKPSKVNTPLLERENQLQTLHAHWSRIVAGYLQLILLTGEAGVGKSRLLARFVEGVDNYAIGKQPLILYARNEATSGGQYSPLMELLRQLFAIAPDDPNLTCRRKVEDRAQILGITSRNFLPLMGYLLGWYQNSARLADTESNLDHLGEAAVEAAVDLFFKQSHHRPTLLILDDLQWADSETLLWLKRLAILKQMTQGENMGYGLMIVLASRPQVGISSEAFQVDNAISLTPLSNAARQELITSLLPGDLPNSLVERLSRESGGNPFYLEEATRGLVQSGQLVQRNGAWQLTRSIDQINVPPGVEGVVMANLDTLDRTTRVVLQHAAVIGQHFSLELLSAITPVNDLEQSLANLEQKGLIRRLADDDAQLFTFTQVIVREVVYNSILRKTRRELHEQIAQLAEAKTAAQAEDVELLAYHYAAGGNQEKMAVYNWLAGRRALESFEFEEAHRHLEIAWNTLRELPAPEARILRDVANALGDAGTFTGNFAQAATCYRVTQELTKQDDELAMIHYKVGRLHFYQANEAEAAKYYEQALELASSDAALVAQIDAEMRVLYDLG